VAIGWSGQWKALISRKGGVNVQAGMEHARFILKPGEAVRSSRMVLTQWLGDDLYRSYNIGRHLMLAHYVPRIDSDVIFPPISKNAAYDELDTKPWRSTHGEQNQSDIIREAKDIGIEYYWLDAYWFKDYFPKGVGNWRFPISASVRDSFPRGLRPLADAVHERGMKFILWFESERVYAGTHIDREKPSWTIAIRGRESRLFNLGLPEARDWITKHLIETLKAFDVDVCRIDFNIDPLAYWQHADAPNRIGISEIRCVEGLYESWDQVRRSKPGLWMDNCASGRRRIDIETCSRAVPLWRSDFNDTPRRRQGEIGAIADQVITHGIEPIYAAPFGSGVACGPLSLAQRNVRRKRHLLRNPAGFEDRGVH